MSKKKVIDLGFTPSEYQQKIFDFVQHGVGNAVIRATAGSGKTTSIVAAMKLVPKKKKCLFIAFNKSIVEELTKRLEGYDNCNVKTLHSLGYLMIRRNLGSDIEIDEYKYRTYLKNNINDLTSISESVKMTRTQVSEYIESISSLIDYSRFNLAQSISEIEDVAKRYSIPVDFDECQVAQKCLKWGSEHYNSIDYTDMVWLPYELLLRPMGLQYDWIFFDEAQDASQMAIELFMRCFKRGTRFIAVGDENQAINAFAGSSPEAFEYLCNYKNTQVFSLPISYRCGKNIVKFANIFSPDMKPRDDAPDGEVLFNCHVRDINDGDMVLARSKAPLLQLYTKLIKRNINCYIKGQDIGSNLVNLLNTIDEEELNPNLDKDGVFVRLYEKLFNERDKMIEKRGLDYNDATLSANVMNLYDTINALSLLSTHCDTKTQLISHILHIFQDDAKGVCLSTIHKAKGLEADNVYILCHSTMPSKLAQQPWEKKQEKNLEYVAYTRPKKRLGFISEKEIHPCGNQMEPIAIINELSFIENKVCKILGKEPLKPMDNSEIARFNLRNATEIKDLHEEDNAVDVIEDKENEDGKDLLQELSDFMNDNK